MEVAILLLTDRVLDFKEQLKRAESKLKTCSDKHKPTFQKARDNIQRWINECNQARLILQNANALNELSKEGKFTIEQLYSAVTPPAGIEELVKELTDALFDAQQIIRIMHGLGMPEDQEKRMWNIYNAMSPEMIRLNKTLKKGNEYLKEQKG
jgi:hypothetical protein